MDLVFLRSAACAVAVAAGLAISPSLFAQQVTRDIVYTTTPTEQRADLYEPAGAGPYPAILYIHGGAWRSGNKSEYKRLGNDLANKGYVGFSINYELHSNSFPTAWQQAREAVRFLHAHAVEYHIDPDRIVIAGASAGGEIAALVALAPEGPPAPAVAGTPTPVAAAIMLNSVYDLTGSYYVIKRYLGGPCSSLGEKCEQASPMHYIHPNAPPFFVGHGNADSVVPYTSAQLFASEMKGEGNTVTMYLVDKGPHMYFLKSKLYDANLAAVEAFLAQTVAKGQP